MVTSDTGWQAEHQPVPGGSSAGQAMVQGQPSSTALTLGEGGPEAQPASRDCKGQEETNCSGSRCPRGFPANSLANGASSGPPCCPHAEPTAGRQPVKRASDWARPRGELQPDVRTSLCCPASCETLSAGAPRATQRVQWLSWKTAAAGETCQQRRLVATGLSSLPLPLWLQQKECGRSHGRERSAPENLLSERRCCRADAPCSRHLQLR